MNIRQEKIIQFLKEVKTAPRQEILEYLASQSLPTNSSRAIQRDLQHLQAMGLVSLKGQGRSAVWVLQEHDEEV